MSQCAALRNGISTTETNQIDSESNTPMLDYHSISINQEAVIAHSKHNNHIQAIRQKRWTENTPTDTHYWNFIYDPSRNTYPGAMGCITKENYAKRPPQQVLDAADEHYRKLIALHNGDISCLEYFSGKHYTDVRERIAKNPNTPAGILTRLARDTDMWVRYYVAINPQAPIEALRILSEDRNSHIRYHMAGNRRISPDILDKLSQDECAPVKNPTAMNHHAPISPLIKAPRNKNNLTKWTVAGNPKMPVTRLEQLAIDPDDNTRRSVASNPSTPIETLQMLMKDKDECVRYEAKHNLYHKTESN